MEKEKMNESESYFQFQDEITKKCISVQMSLLECLLDCQPSKNKENDVLTIKLDESILNFALQIYFRKNQIKNVIEKE